MRRAASLLVIPLLACAHEPEPLPEIPEPAEPEAVVHHEAVALEFEIYEPHDGSTVSRPAVLTPVGKPAWVAAEFTVRPARKHVRMLAIEMTPTKVDHETCSFEMRSQVIDDPRLLLAGTPLPTEIPAGEWVDVVTTDMVAARVRCTPPGAPSTLAHSAF